MYGCIQNNRLNANDRGRVHPTATLMHSRMIEHSANDNGPQIRRKRSAFQDCRIGLESALDGRRWYVLVRPRSEFYVIRSLSASDNSNVADERLICGTHQGFRDRIDRPIVS